MRLYFLYCPFCKGNGWHIMSGPSDTEEKIIVHHRCDSCRRFTFCNYVIKPNIILKIGFSAEEADSIEAQIDDYTIKVNYSENKTYFRKKLPPVVDIMSPFPKAFEMIIDHAIEFDWHDQDRILQKIKTYIMLG